MAIDQRDPDVPLSELGQAQARALGRWLAELTPTAGRPRVVARPTCARSRRPRSRCRPRPRPRRRGSTSGCATASWASSTGSPAAASAPGSRTRPTRRRLPRQALLPAAGRRVLGRRRAAAALGARRRRQSPPDAGPAADRLPRRGHPAAPLRARGLTERHSCCDIAAERSRRQRSVDLASSATVAAVAARPSSTDQDHLVAHGVEADHASQENAMMPTRADAPTRHRGHVCATGRCRSPTGTKRSRGRCSSSAAAAPRRAR